jgi:hypothetical protein
MGWQPTSYIQIFLEWSSPLLAREAVVFEGTAVLPRYFICSTKTCEGMYFTIQMIISRLSTRSTYRNISNLKPQGHLRHLKRSEAIECMQDVAIRCLIVLFLLPTKKLNLRLVLEDPIVDHYVLASTIISNLRWTSSVGAPVIITNIPCTFWDTRNVMLHIPINDHFLMWLLDLLMIGLVSYDAIVFLSW